MWIFFSLICLCLFFMSSKRWLSGLNHRQNYLPLYISHECRRNNLSSHYQNNIKQTSDEIKEKNFNEGTISRSNTYFSELTS